MDVIVIAGQSNAVGCTNISTLGDEWISDQFPNGMLYQEGNFDPYSYGCWIQGIHIGMGCNSGQFGLEYGIASVLEKNDKPYAILRYALGGSSLFWDWMPRTNWNVEPQFIAHPGYSYRMWSETVTRGLCRLLQLGYLPNIRALVWMQGESDANQTAAIAEAYENHLRDLFHCMRAELRTPDLPILIGEIATNAPLCPWSDRVREAQRRIADESSNNYLITTGDLPIGADGLHFDGAEMLALGKRFGMKLSELR